MEFHTSLQSISQGSCRDTILAVVSYKFQNSNMDLVDNS